MDSTEFVNNQTFNLVNDFIGHVIWPVILLLFIATFRGKISTLFESIKRLKFADIEAEFDKREKTFAEEEVSPLNDEMDGIVERIKLLELELAQLRKEPITKEVLDEEAIKSRIMDALEKGLKRWRSIQRLAVLSGANEDEVLKILRNENSVVLGQGKSGRQIARLKNR